MKKIFIMMTTMFILSAHAETQYMIVVDGGSSGSKLYLYSYDQSAPGALPTNIKTVATNKAAPGLEDIRTADIPNYLTTLFNGAAKTTAAPVYFYATASMRIISPTIQDADYKAISQWISQNTKAHVEDIRTIPGSYEAFYDWIADNDLQSGFQNPQNLRGVLDMGGGSMEIAYPADAQDPQAIPFRINGQPIYVHAQSYLGLGEDYSRYQYSTDESCYPNDYPMPNESKGLGSARQCEADIQPLFDVHRVQPPQFRVTAIPFDAFSGFYYAAQTLLQENGNFNLNLDTYQQAAAAFCADNWEQILSDPKYVAAKDYVYSYCYAASEQIALLKELGFRGCRSNITAVSKINGNSVDWTLGVLIEKAMK